MAKEKRAAEAAAHSVSVKTPARAGVVKAPPKATAPKPAKASAAPVKPAKAEAPKAAKTAAAPVKPEKAEAPKAARAAAAPVKPEKAEAAKSAATKFKPAATKSKPAATAASKPVKTAASPVKPAKAEAPKPAAAEAKPAVAAAAPQSENDPFHIQAFDPEKLASNAAKMLEQGGKALAAYLKPREAGEKKALQGEEIVDVVRTLGQVAEYWLKDPQRTVEAQTDIMSRYLDLWSSSLRRMSGEEAEPVAKPDPRDARFKDPQWTENPFFDFLKQFYLTTTDWAGNLVKNAELDPHLKHKADFYTRLVTSALSPSNFPITNPEVIRETIATNGANLVRGTHMLAEDIRRGKGDLKIRQSDESSFEMGRNIALSPGKVIFQNDLIQLLQYQASTEKVGAIPLLIVPPWINKFYILDLNPEKSFIKWAVDQGLSVFVISWVNPDARHAKKSFDDYMQEGPITALKVVNELTGQKRAHTIGYCVGGTLLAVTLAYLAAKGDDLVQSATFFTTQVDFKYAGDLKVFADEENIALVEKQMEETGFLDGSNMASAFNMLRANDLIWSNVVNNYLKGKKPMPFDLLYWNADSTRMPAANHSFYLRHCYLNNDLSAGRMEVGGVKLDLSKITVPVYNLAAREDHIAPAHSAFEGSKFFGGTVDYVMGGSGHIAGVVNPPYKVKYQYWTGGPVKGSFKDWVAKATEHAGSWWPHWREWIRARDGQEVPARAMGSKKYKPLEDAPGSYVKVRV